MMVPDQLRIAAQLLFVLRTVTHGPSYRTAAAGKKRRWLECRTTSYRVVDRGGVEAHWHQSPSPGSQRRALRHILRGVIAKRSEVRGKI